MNDQCFCDNVPKVWRLTGVTRTLRLRIFNPDGTPCDLTGRDVVVTVSRDNSDFAYAPGFVVEGDNHNVIKFPWAADKQGAGDYTITATATDGSDNVDRVNWHGPTGIRLVDYSYMVKGSDAAGVESDSEVGLEGTYTMNGTGMSAYDEWLASDESTGYPHTVVGFMTYLKQPATDAAEAAEATMTEIQSRADDDHTTAGSDHTRAATDHTTAESDHTRAEEDHQFAFENRALAHEDHLRAEDDHTTAAADHTTAQADHATAGSDHTRAEADHATAASDHSTAASDHTKAGQDSTRAGSDHDIAVADHAQAEADHTRAESDHTTAAADHTTAAADHTTAASDHTTAAADHTQAVADHAVMAGYDTRLTNVETDVTQLGQKVVGDIYQSTATDFATYNPCIAELYINPYYLNGITNVDFRCYAQKIYCVSDSWQVVQPLAGKFNGNVIPIVATTAGGNAEVGNVVGYVIFKDIATFIDNPVGAVRNPLNLSFVQRLQSAPTIAASLEIQREAKIIFFQYPTNVSQVATYESCIAELFIAPNLIGSAKSISVSSYANSVYAYFGSTADGGTVLFRCTTALTDYVNGDIIPLKVAAAGEGLTIGDIVGYIIFKDIATFKATIYGSTKAFVDLAVVCDIVNAPTILSSQFITKDIEPIYIPNASISQIAVYETCVEEIWVNPNYGSADKYSFRNYTSNAYLNYLEAGKTFECKVPLTNYANGDIIPLVVTTPGGEASVGDIVGYAIFKDLTTFKTTNYWSNTTYLNLDRAFSLLENQKIWNATVFSKESIYKMIDDRLSQESIPVLPAILYAAVGVEMNIYNDTVAFSLDKGLASPTNYIVRWQCNKGTITNRGFRYTPQAGDIGDVSLTCYIYSMIGELYVAKTITIKVIAGQLSSAKRVVFFGDSIGGGTATWLYNDFNDEELFSGTQPQMLGIRGTTPKYEAFGGARWTDYATAGRAAYRCQVANVGPIALGSQYTNNGYTWEVVEVHTTAGTGNILITRNDLYSSTIAPQVNGTLIPVGGGDNISYTGATKEAANPLWYNDAIDFAHYRNTLGLGANEKLDLVSFQLGSNGDEDNATLTQYISALYNAAIADNANCIFLLGLTPGSCNTLDAYGINYGAKDWMEVIKKLHARRQLYVGLVESGDYPNMRLATPNLNLDRYYGFPTDTRAVSARNSTQEEYHTNFLHPNPSGYAQLGDAFFSAYVATLNE